MPAMLHGIGRDGALCEVEKFICHLYKAPQSDAGVDIAHYDLFKRGKKTLEQLPPTQDALDLHVRRANVQAAVWLQANKANMQLTNPALTGAWKEQDGHLEIIWKTLPSVPESCNALITCQCTEKCRTKATNLSRDAFPPANVHILA